MFWSIPDQAIVGGVNVALTYGGDHCCCLISDYETNKAQQQYRALDAGYKDDKNSTAGSKLQRDQQQLRALNAGYEDVQQYRIDKEASTAASRGVSVQQNRLDSVASIAASKGVSVPQLRIDQEASTAASRDVSVTQYRLDREASIAASRGVSVTQYRIDKKELTKAKKAMAVAMSLTLKEYNKLPQVKLENQALKKKRAHEAEAIKNKNEKKPKV